MTREQLTLELHMAALRLLQDPACDGPDSSAWQCVLEIEMALRDLEGHPLQ